MSTINLLQSCRLEFRKAKGKHTWLLFFALLGINMAYLFWGMRQADAKTLSTAWEQTLFCPSGQYAVSVCRHGNSVEQDNGFGA